MTLRENFELIQNETRNEENLFHVLELYEQVSKEDALLYFDISMYLVDYYLEQDDFSSAIKTCEDFLKEDLSLEYKKQLLIIDKFIAVLLKIEDFHKLEEVLHIRLRYSSEDKQANMMQYFYLAVCYEGLHRYHDAIQVLNTIPDTLSNNNLVSKYLKLAMLTLRVSQPNDALDFYNKAVLFDPKRKNTMFYLVDSDILYAQGEYKKSLDSFQDFFLKSKTNHRYLDRFIIISLALEHYQEAYHFYKEYEPRVRQSISKSYQLQFYEATLEMFKRMNMTNEFLEIQDRINYLNNHEQSIINQFGLVETFYTELSKIKDFEKTRDLYLHASRAFHQAYEPKSFHFFEISDESFLLYTFRKHLLIEKKIKKDTSNTFLEILRNQTTRIEIYHPSSFNLYEDLPDPIFMNAELVICIKLNMVFDYPSFCFITLDNPTEFDTSYRLMSILSTWINQQLLYLNIAKEQKDLHQLLLQIPLVFHQAIIRFDKGKILYFNDYAKSLLPMISRNDTFDKIQKHIVSPRIYFDDFLTQKDLRLTLQITEDKVLHLDVKSIATDTNLLLVFQESKEIKSEEKTESKKFLRSNILSFHHLEEKYLSYEAASTFIYFEIDHFE
ncbi:MAG: tetratricopeptide repeat protein, partial [Candidatus Izemoplasmatales bacterium]